MIFLCHDNFLEWMSVNFCVSNVWDIKCELGRPMNSHVVVPVSMVPFLFTFFFCWSASAFELFQQIEA